MAEPKLIIRRQKSKFWLVMWASGFLSVLFISFYLGRYLAVQEEQQLQQKQIWLESQLEQYQQAYEQVNQSLVMQTQSSRVDTESNIELMDTIKQLKGNLTELQEELQFYRNIMAPERAQQGLTIADFELNQTSIANTFRFKLVLTQAGKQEQLIKGQTNLKLSGIFNGEKAVYEFRELGTFQAKDFQFQFRYFQNIEGTIELPDGFIADEVLILAKTTGLRKNQVAEKEFGWNI